MRSFYLIPAVLLAGLAALFPACNGAKGPAGPSGASAVPTPYCSSPNAQGLTIAGSSSGFTTGVISANAITLATASTAVSLSLNVASGAVSGQMILGIYENNAGAPGNLVVESNPQNIAVGWNSAELPPTYLPAGVYWLGENCSNAFNGTYNASGGKGYNAAYSWGVLPPTFPSGSAEIYQMAIYLSTCP